MPRIAHSRIWIAAAAVLALAAFHFWPHHGAGRVKHAVHWPSDCTDVRIDHGARPPYLARWRGVADRALVECQVMGPAVFYARFTDAAALRRSLSSARPADPVCEYGDEVVVDGLDTRAEFVRVCGRLHGHVT